MEKQETLHTEFRECRYRISDFEMAQTRMLLRGFRVVFDAFYYAAPTRFVRLATGTIQKENCKKYRVSWDHLGRASIAILIDRTPEFDLIMEPETNQN